MNFNERILNYLKLRGISKLEFYNACGLSNGFLDKTPNPTLENILKIIKAFPDLNLEWLITGKGDMIKKVSSEQEQLKELQDKLMLMEELITTQKKHIQMLEKQLADCERNQKNSVNISKTSAELKK